MSGWSDIFQNLSKKSDMIARISSGSNFYGAAKYNQIKVDKGQGAVLEYKGILNTQPRTIDQTLSSFNNSRTQKPVFHASLSFSPKDIPNLNDQKLVEISKDYMERMGYGKQPYVIYRHDDTIHPHVHILTTRVDIEKGKRIEKYKEGIKSKGITEILEKKYDLTIAESQSHKLKSQIYKDVSEVLRQEKPESINSLNRHLSAMESDIRAKSYKNGIFYFKEDKSGKRFTRPTKSSFFKGTEIVHDQVKATFKKNRAMRMEAKQIVQNALPRKDAITQTQFRRNLESKGVTPIFYKNEQGNIYGVSFNYKDHTYKGSDLDRKLSFGNIKGRLEILHPIAHELKQDLLDKFKSQETIVNKGIERFNSGTPQLDKKLSHMSTYDRTNLIMDHNAIVRRAKNNAPKINEMFNEYEDRLDLVFKQLKIEPIDLKKERKLKISLTPQRERGLSIGRGGW